MNTNLSNRQVKVIGSYVTALSFDDQIRTILLWGSRRLSKVVCVANVHMLMEAHWNPTFARLLESADLVTPDGMPLVWMIRQVGIPQDRVAGMDLMIDLCKAAPTHNVSVYFLGSKPEILKNMGQRLRQEFPDLQVAGLQDLPFRPLTPEEDEAMIQKINDSGAGIVFVSLGCPKQEKFIDLHRSRIRAVMIGIGAVFPVYAGLQKPTPSWMKEAGLEWFYRLLQEPKRLWKRYGTTIPPFIMLATKQLLTEYQLLERLRHRESDWAFSPISTDVLIDYPNGLVCKPLGRVLRRAGLLSIDEVQQVLQAQEQAQSLRFGDILTRQGRLKPETVQFFAEQLPELVTEHQKKPLGYYLKSAALLDEDQITEILRNQQQTGLRFGEMAVNEGWVKQETVDLLLDFLSPPSEESFIETTIRTV